MNFNEIVGYIPPVTKIILFTALFLTVTCYMDIF